MTAAFRRPAMMPRTGLLLMTLWLACWLDTSRADLIRLKSGDVLRGRMVSVPEPDQPGPLRIQLLDGTAREVLRDEVAELIERPVKVEEYELRAAGQSDTLDAHWKMAEWCRGQGLTEQRKGHLERVLSFAPEHRQAHYGLGHTLQGGLWLTRAQYEQRQRDQGLVEYNGKWVPVDKLAGMQARDAQTKAQLDWYPQVRIWLKWLKGSEPRRAADGLANLRGVRSPDAVPALTQFLGKDSRADVRALLITIVRQIEGEPAATLLAMLALRDEDMLNREAALKSLPEEHYGRTQTVFIEALRDSRNVFVRRAGEALGRTGDEAAIPALIRALNTTHQYRIQVPVEGYGGSPVVSMIPPEIEAGIRTGVFENVTLVPHPAGPRIALKEIQVPVTHQNAEVLTALKHLSQADFGFNERAWIRWWTVDRGQQLTAPEIP